MQFYVAIEGEKRGPLSAYRIIDQLRAGELSADALGWEPGMEAWCKLRDIPAFAEVIEVLENPPEPGSEGGKAEGPGDLIPNPRAAEPGAPTSRVADAAAGTTTEKGRPFIRFFARIFDYMLVSAVAWQFCDVPPIPETITPMDLLKNDGTVISEEALIALAKIHYAALLIWQFIEGLLMHTWGTTPGKAIFNVRMTARDGSPLPLVKGLGRSFLVWFAGFGLGLFPFNLIGMAIGLFMLLFTGATFWDRQLEVKVHHGPMTPGRILMAIGGFFLLMIISSLKFS